MTPRTIGGTIRQPVQKAPRQRLKEEIKKQEENNTTFAHASVDFITFQLRYGGQAGLFVMHFDPCRFQSQMIFPCLASTSSL